MDTNWYPEYHRQVQRRIRDLDHAAPGPMGGFTELNRQTLAEGALGIKTKELMALAVAIYARCEGCLAYHVHDCLRAGATREELLETISVAVLMGGAPALVYGAEALEAVGQFQATHEFPAPGKPADRWRRGWRQAQRPRPPGLSILKGGGP